VPSANRGDLILTGWGVLHADQLRRQANHFVDRRPLVDRRPGGLRGGEQAGAMENQGVLSIVKALAAPYGLAVRSEIPETGKLSDHTIEPGETAFESIDRLLTLFRVFSTDDAKGMVVLAKPGSEGRAVDALQLGKNVLAGNTQLDFSTVFSEYQVLGQRSGTDDDSAKRRQRYLPRSAMIGPHVSAC